MNTHVTDAGLEQLKSLTQLDELNFAQGESHMLNRSRGSRAAPAAQRIYGARRVPRPGECAISTILSSDFPMTEMPDRL
jgi:hypothetical protein